MTNAQYFAIIAAIIYVPRMTENVKTFVFWMAIAGVIISSIGVI
jgi:hypothetical protein